MNLEKSDFENLHRQQPNNGENSQLEMSKFFDTDSIEIEKQIADLDQKIKTAKNTTEMQRFEEERNRLIEHVKALTLLKGLDEGNPSTN